MSSSARSASLVPPIAPTPTGCPAHFTRAPHRRPPDSAETRSGLRPPKSLRRNHAKRRRGEPASAEKSDPNSEFSRPPESYPFWPERPSLLGPPLHDNPAPAREAVSPISKTRPTACPPPGPPTPRARRVPSRTRPDPAVASGGGRKPGGRRAIIAPRGRCWRTWRAPERAGKAAAGPGRGAAGPAGGRSR
jgi:hypothetical protein